MNPVFSPLPMRAPARLVATALCALLAVAPAEGKRYDQQTSALPTLRPLPRTKRKSPRIQPAKSLHPQPLTPRRPGNPLFHQTKLQLHPTDRRPRRAAEKNMSAPPSAAGARRVPTKSSLPSLPPLNCGPWRSSWPTLRTPAAYAGVTSLRPLTFRRSRCRRLPGSRPCLPAR